MNTANRVLWSVIGAVLVVAGIAGILANQGWLVGVDAHRVLLDPRAGDTWRRWGVWAPILAIVAGAVVAGLGLWLLRAELRIHARPSMPDTTMPDRTPPATAPSGTAGGYTRVDTAVLVRAMRKDLQADPRINRAHVRITGRPEHPEVSLRLDVEQGIDLQPVHERVNRTLNRFTAMMPGTPTIDEVLVSSGRGAPAGRRVR